MRGQLFWVEPMLDNLRYHGRRPSAYSMAPVKGPEICAGLPLVSTEGSCLELQNTPVWIAAARLWGAAAPLRWHN